MWVSESLLPPSPSACQILPSLGVEAEFSRSAEKLQPCLYHRDLLHEFHGHPDYTDYCDSKYDVWNVKMTHFVTFQRWTWPWRRRRAVILGWQTAAPSTSSLRKPPATTLTRLGTRSSSLALTLAKLWDYFLAYFVMTAMHWCNHKIHCEIICSSCLNTSIKEM